MTTTKQQQRAAFTALAAVCETIREAGSVPSGTLYAALMSKGCSLEQYERLLQILKGTDLVSESPAHLLTWIGPRLVA